MLTAVASPLTAQKCDGLFEGETTFGRVTGNNVVSWTPHLNDWYKTVKLNYGFNFTDPTKSVREYPNAWTPEKAIPDTWKKMDQVIAHWQSLASMDFAATCRTWSRRNSGRGRSRRPAQRQPGVFFMGEAYDDDPAKCREAIRSSQVSTAAGETCSSIC